MNDVFTTILRDVQWFYDEQTQQLKITGTWKNNGLFAQSQFDEETKKSLQHEGEVEINLFVENGQIVAEHTASTLTPQNVQLLQMSGTAALSHFFEVYIAQ